ncbi:hypothetical protein [Streptomyces sp. IB201691-2A2]|uniref:hypothetical protein n=1 Tax=Streptomyces sp. IB201691-2A2 TaxID=2561920 RepID=UPI00163D3E5A|nr:hypothetical protein [Streptomyces sp. IB201691-2A2]
MARASDVKATVTSCCFRGDGIWRRNMARSFDDLVADFSSEAGVEPRCTAEEMALHLGIARAAELTRNRPRFVREAVGDLPEDSRDFDWSTLPTSSSRTTMC